MKKLIILVSLCLLAVAAYERITEYASTQISSNYETPAPIQTSQSTPLPQEIEEPAQPFGYTYVTGRILSIQGLVADNGAIHEAVEWLL